MIKLYGKLCSLKCSANTVALIGRSPCSIILGVVAMWPATSCKNMCFMAWSILLMTNNAKWCWTAIKIGARLDSVWSEQQYIGTACGQCVMTTRVACGRCNCCWDKRQRCSTCDDELQSRKSGFHSLYSFVTRNHNYELVVGCTWCIVDYVC